MTSLRVYLFASQIAKLFRIIWVCPRDAQRDALSNEVALYRLSYCCVFYEEVLLPLGCLQASSVAKIASEAALYYAACLLSSRCASRGVWLTLGDSGCLLSMH